jgi:hypothetical protein
MDGLVRAPNVVNVADANLPSSAEWGKPDQVGTKTQAAGLSIQNTKPPHLDSFNPERQSL